MSDKNVTCTLNQKECARVKSQKLRKITEVEKSLAVISSKLDFICTAIKYGNRYISGSPTIETGSLILKVYDSKYVLVSN